MNFAEKVMRKVENRMANKVVGRITDSAVKGAKSVADKARSEDPKATVPKKDIAKEIKHHKRQFDYIIIRTDEGKMFVVDAKVKLDRTIDMYLKFRPTEDPLANYSQGRARYNVTTQSYELVDEDAPVQGTFPVHVIRMED